MSAEATQGGPALDAVIPDGHLPIPISPGQKAAPLRICVLARATPDPVAGHLVVLRDTADARVYLGAVVDAWGWVHQWVELWVQTLDGMADALAAWREALSNAALDAQWQRRAQLWSSADVAGGPGHPRLLVGTGWEARHPLPMWLDLGRREPVAPTDAAGELWRLCQDDALLASVGLPPYGATPHRYLHLPKRGAASPFVPVTPGAPTNERTQPPESVTEGRPGLIPFNPGGGLLMVRAHGGVPLEALLDVLGGGPAAPLLRGRSPVDAGCGAAARALGAAAPGGGEPGKPPEGWLSLGRHGQAGRLLEAYHLRLRVLADAIEAVRSVVAQTQRPLLDLGADRFEVRVGAPGPGLPVLWTAKALLVDPGDTVELPVGQADATGARYFLPGRPLPASVYRPAPAGQAAAGRCEVRLRKVSPGAGGSTVLEGTLSTQERVQAAPRDLVRLRLSLGGGRLDLHAHFEPEAGMAEGEWRFRTVGQRLDPAVAGQARAAEGVPLANSWFELLPLMSTPWDLYSLAVLGVRALLVNSRTTLPKALDDLLGLARQVAAAHDPAVPLRQRVRAAFERDPRHGQQLGPHRLRWDGPESGPAPDPLPAELWWDTLGMLLRMLPGVGPDSTCADYGDARPGELHRVFDAAAADLGGLLLRSRGLVVADWRHDREVLAVLRGFLAGSAGLAPPPVPPASPPPPGRSHHRAPPAPASGGRKR